MLHTSHACRILTANGECSLPDACASPVPRRMVATRGTKGEFRWVQGYGFVVVVVVVVFLSSFLFFSNFI